MVREGLRYKAAAVAKPGGNKDGADKAAKVANVEECGRRDDVMEVNKTAGEEQPDEIDIVKEAKTAKPDENAKVDKVEAGEQPSTSQISSANKWEDADFGDEKRKEKFLKLMGAGKKQHKGRFVIGDAEPNDAPLEHKRSKREIETLEDMLESQFTQCVSDQLKRRDLRRRGLGYEGSDSDLPKNDSFTTVVETKVSAGGMESGEC